jgi:hypothetical protein
MTTLSRKPLYVLGGAITGFVGTYLLTKPTLRDKLKRAKSLDEAFDAVGKQLHDDAQDISNALHNPPRGSLLRRVRTSFNRGSRTPMLRRFWRGAAAGTQAVLAEPHDEKTADGD